MLNTVVCAQRLQQHTTFYVSLYQDQLKAAYAVWQTLIQRPDIHQAVCESMGISSNYPLHTVFALENTVKHYAVCGIDGSQIYPDRHQGSTDYLINIGTACFNYTTESSAILESEPFIFSGVMQGVMITADYVNSQRADYELQRACLHAQTHNESIIMVDGALMFWNLQSPELQHYFLSSYNQHLSVLKKHNTTYIGYISASHSRQLVLMLESAARLLHAPVTMFDYVYDTDIMNLFLKPGTYTQPAKSGSWVSEIYPAELEPYYAYLNVASEIARIEMPAYIACNPDRVAYSMQVIIDQCAKGYGYPIALSEAHEQAVVTSADREHFYALLRIMYPGKDTMSLKLSSKRTPCV